MNTEAQITLERQEGRGVYLLPLPGSEPARVTFVDTGPARIAIDYSFVPPSHRGRGIALKLVAHIVDEARTHRFKITPLCGYVAREFRNHPEWDDVLATRR